MWDWFIGAILKKEDIPFNMEFSMDSILRERADDSVQMRKGVSFLKEKLEEEKDELKLASILSLIGGFERILIELSESEKTYHLALEKYKEAGRKALGLGVKLRLAVTHQWKKEFDKADNIFLGAISRLEKTEAPKLQHYLNFAYQHYGKSLFEQERFGVALDNFVLALELRLAQGDLKLINDTQDCIEKTKEALSEQKKKNEEN